MSTPPPTLADWEISQPFPWPPTTDEAHAYHLFFGKTISDSAVCFQNNPYGATEAFTYMSQTCRLYYFQGLTEYLRSESSHSDSDSVGCFLSLIEQLHPSLRIASNEIKSATLDTLGRIENNLDWYGLSQDWHSGLIKQLPKCRHLIEDAG